MKRKITAVAIPQENPFVLAAKSAKNLLLLVNSFMYGTPERAQMTVRFALVLALLGTCLSISETGAALSCIN